MTNSESLRPHLSKLATLWGIGHARKAPGTWGTVAAVPVAVAFALAGPLPYMALTCLVLILAIVACNVHEQDSGDHDSQRVVIDEVVGYLVAATWLPFTWKSFLAAFILFRVFDIWKPLFIGLLDRKVSGGLGTVVDDLAAGLVVNVILQLVYMKTSWLGLQWEWGLRLSSWEPDLQKLISKLRERKLTVAFAESCTGGLLSASLAALPGVSDIFMGSIVCYSYSAKTDLLGVSWETLNSKGAVSEEVALQMARGACERLKANCTISITGIAGPTGGTADKPVGTVWFGVKGPGFEVSERKQFDGDRESVQKQSVAFALKLLNSKI